MTAVGVQDRNGYTQRWSPGRGTGRRGSTDSSSAAAASIVGRSAGAGCSSRSTASANATTHAWADAAELKSGDRLDTPGDGHVTVVADRRYPDHVRTFNLSVDTVHTHYVLAGNTPVLVHNTEGCGPETYYRGSQVSSLVDILNKRARREPGGGELHRRAWRLLPRDPRGRRLALRGQERRVLRVDQGVYVGRCDGSAARRRGGDEGDPRRSGGTGFRRSGVPHPRVGVRPVQQTALGRPDRCFALRTSKPATRSTTRGGNRGVSSEAAATARRRWRR
ncbi:hypothetical protein SAMN04489730_7467 [Amycolatopsis australiensis]|uniref:Intein C-terminal splicing region n=1 Tax=Amycolatopsis australiensis TaxID=546364 RepID=A0A1K1T0S1_9PSEU|nr:hypothetical protein SAMN04489730_7467 [Amycolatopsis australiensis]